MDGTGTEAGMICQRCKRQIERLPIIAWDDTGNRSVWHISCADENSLDDQMKAAGLA